MPVDVVNLSTDVRMTFVGVTPRQAVMAAFAQSHGDFNTWDYEKKYGPSVKEGKATFSCGNWCALKQPKTMAESQTTKV